MPELSDSLAKVSEQMTALSQRAKAAEEHSAEARTQTRQEIEMRISELKAEGQRQRRAWQAESQYELGSRWSDLGASVEERLDSMRTKIDEQRDDHDAKLAERRAERAEGHAADAIGFATYVIVEAEASVLKAAEARAVADAHR